LLKRLNFIFILPLFFLLAGCSLFNPDVKEAEEYFETFFDSDLSEKLDESFEETLNIIAEGNTDQGLDHLREETIPIAEDYVEFFEKKELNNEDLKEFNEYMTEVTMKERDRYLYLEETFQGIVDDFHQNQMNELNFLEPLEKIITLNEEIYDNLNKAIDKMKELSEIFDQLEIKEDVLQAGIDDYKPDNISELYGLLITEFIFILAGDTIDYDAFYEAILAAEEGELEDAIGEDSDENEQPKNDDSTDNEVTYDINIDEYIDDIGSTTVVFDAEAYIEDAVLYVEGTSNLLEGSTVHLLGEMYGSESNVYGLKDEMTVDASGDFTTAIEIGEDNLSEDPVELTLSYRPAGADQEHQDIYGEKGELLEGPFARSYVSSMRTTYGAFTFALIELKEGISETFSVSELDPPADYGELDIWMEVEQFDIHNEYYNISLNSNLLALTSIRVDIDVPNYTLAGYNYRGKITDDGSITFQLPRVDEEVENSEEVIFEVIASFDGVLETIDLYGMDGENFEGDLVDETDKGKRIKYEFTLDDVR